MKFFSKSKTKKKKIETLAVLVALTALALLLSAVGVTFAKYRMDLNNSTAVYAKPFYFTSNTLKNSYTKLQRESDGSVTIKIDFRNYIDHLRINDENVDYSFKLEIIENSSVIETLATEEGTFPANTETEFSKEYSVGSQYLTDGVLIKATANTVGNDNASRYSKSLTQEYGFSENISMTDYEVIDNGDTVVMYVGGVDSGDSITIRWPDGFVPNAVGLDISVSSDNSMEITAEAGSVYRIEFYKRDTGSSVDLRDFTAE